MAAHPRCFCLESKTVLEFCLVNLLLFKLLIKLCLPTQAMSVLVFFASPVLHVHVIAIKAYYPVTNRTLIHRIGFSQARVRISTRSLKGALPR